MKKLIIICPHCAKKMKISNKIAKYKCPHCSTIYKFNIFKFIITNIENFFMGIIDSTINFFKIIPQKWRNFVVTYKYMKQVRQHLKNDPNWSNYHKQQREARMNNQANSFFSKLKNKFGK